MNLLEVKYDEDGTRRFYRDGQEVSENEWMQQHPHMRKGKSNGRDRNQDSGNVGNGDERVKPEDDPEGPIRQGVRQRREQARQLRIEDSQGE